MVRFKGRYPSVAVVLVIMAISWFNAASASVQEPAGTAEISSIELLPGVTAETFTLRVRCSRAVEFTTFWVKGRIFVLDIRDAYTPFRGDAVREWEAFAVGAVRASQFMESPVPIARVEVDVTAALGSTTRLTGTDIEVAFGPPGPSIPAAGRWLPPPGTTGAPQPAAVDTGAAEPVVTPPAAQQTTPLPGGRVNPFDPILKPQGEVDRTNTLTRPLPNAEQLTLTGIIYDENKPDESVALLRDNQGANFRLKKGDRVLYGFVSRITAKEVMFSLDIYGRRKEVRLTLENPQER